MTTQEACENWQSWLADIGCKDNTAASYSRVLWAFMQDAGVAARPVRSVTESHVGRWLNGTPGSLSTRRVRRAALLSFCTYCDAKGYIRGNPAALTRIDKSKLSYRELEPKVRQPFTDDEIVKLRTVSEPFWRGVILLGLSYGFRLGDVARLEWTAFHVRDKIVVHTQKSGKRLELPLVDEVRHFYAGFSCADPDVVYPEQYEIINNPTRRGLLSAQFIGLCRGLGITGKSAHSLRHAFASQRRALGDSVEQIREAMAHSSTATTEGYIH